MANLCRMRVPWTGGGVTGGGLSTFYFEAASSGFVADVKTFFDGIKSAIPNSISISVPDNGDMISDLTGALSGTWAETGTGGTVAGTSSATWAGGVGYRVVWNTAGIFQNRRVRGSTFICPLSTAAYDAQGTIEPVTLAAHRTIASTLVTQQPNMRIWSRPKPGVSGESNDVVSATIPDAVSWLRSRRT